MASVWDWLSDRADRTFNGNISADERRKREREEAEAAERQRLIEAQRLADLEAQQAGYIDDAYAADQYRKQQDQARTNTASAIEIGRQNVAAGPSSTQYRTEPAPYVADKKARLTSDPFLVVEDEQVDPTPSPMAYVLTGETYTDPSQAPAAAKPESKSNAFWDFLGLQDQEDRKRWSNGMLRAGGAILGAGTPDWAEALGKGVGAYAKAGDDYDKAAQDRTLIDQKRRANEIALAEGEKSKSVQAQIARIYQDAGPNGLSSTQKQQVASLYAGIGEFKAAQELLGTNVKPVNYQKGETYYSPEGALYTQVFDPATGRTAMLDTSGNVVTDQSVINTLRIDDKKRAGGAGGMPELTKGEEKRDEEFGKNYETTANDYNRNQVQIAQLDETIRILETTPNASGNIVLENAPAFLKPYINTDGTIAREKTYEVVQGTLRQVLGAQFTEREGEMIMARAFNPNLPVDENVKRVRALAEMLKSNSQQNINKLNYFDQNGTLKGFRGNYLSADDISNNVFGDNGNRPQSNMPLSRQRQLPAHLRPRG
ncbi:hypothetical protein ACQZ45_24825 [Agrobacterium sp. 16-2014-1-2a]